MRTLTVNHRTTYRYDRPVRFGAHRLMVRPRDSHEFRLLDAKLRIAPQATSRWLFDIFGNSIAKLEFEDSADRLDIESAITLEHHGIELPDFHMVEDYARRIPFSYAPEESGDLGRTHRLHSRESGRQQIRDWAERFLDAGHTGDTVETLMEMNRHIQRSFEYRRREEPGTQEPAYTLDSGNGSCRDFALLFMEAVRSLGIAARFVTGYLYDPATDGGTDTVQGAGATHAWASVYLPGAGWVDFDPTNGLAGTRNLITVATARAPSQAIPVDGSYFGPPEAFQSMEVEVLVTQSST